MNRSIRVAIVDDHDMIRQTWKMILQRFDGIEVVAECASGEEAIACANAQLPDVMLMDINMSPMNGFEATAEIVKKFPSINIIGISINNQPTYARNLLQLGAKGYVTKNSSSDEMVKAIKMVTNNQTYVCKDVIDRLDGKPLI